MSAPEHISSASNPLVKEIRKAAARGGLTADGLAVAESFHLLDEALRSGAAVGAIVAAESARRAVEARLKGRHGARLVVVPDGLFGRISATESAQGVLALVRLPSWSLESLFGGTPLIAVLDGVQDPGNAGAIVRSAEAFGATGVVFLKGSAAPFHPKTLRAAAGSLFRIPYAAGVDAAAAREAFERRSVSVYAALACTGSGGGAAADLSKPCAIVIGSEGRGVSGPMRRGAAPLSIPTAAVESLNASVAAGILLYEARRQRTSR